VEEILEDLKAASPEDPVYTLNQELTRYSFLLKYKVCICTGNVLRLSMFMIQCPRERVGGLEFFRKGLKKKYLALQLGTGTGTY
jgi:hypothetical protein